MVGVTKIKGKAGAGYAEYLTSLSAAGDYYVAEDGGPGEPPGEWVGLTEAEMLELGVDPANQVTREELEDLMRGLNPETGEQLRRASSTGTMVAAIDVVFSVPKSVSLVWAAADLEMRAAIEAEVRAAVAEVLDYVGHELEIVRVGNGSQTGRAGKAEGVLAATFLHSTSRLTGGEEDGIPDPQLHIHSLLLGAKRSDGKLVAINSWGLMMARHEMDGRGMATLFERLEHNLGFEVERTVDAKGRVKVELAGVSQELIKVMSRRTTDIDVAKAAFRLEHKREPTAGEIRVLSLQTRGTKTAMPRAGLFEAWAAKIAQFGGATGRRSKPRSAKDRAVQFRAELVHYLNVELAIADDRKLNQMAAQLAKGLLSAKQMDAQIELMKREGELVKLDDGRWTTKPIRALEVEAMAATSRLIARPGLAAPTQEALDAAVAAIEVERGLELSPEQRVALRTITGGGGLTGMIGRAGTGKGVVMASAAKAWQAQGLTVIGMARDGLRTVALKTELGVPTTMTLDSMLLRVNSGRLVLTPRHVLLVDEAAMLDHRLMEGVLAVADTARAKLVLVGDSAQLQSISAGGLFRSITKIAPTAELTEVRRAREAWEREAQDMVRDGKGGVALEEYASRGRLHVADARPDMRTEMAAAWNEARKGLKLRDILMVVDSSNWERDQLNLLAQAYRRADGELGEAGLTVGAKDRAQTIQAHVGDRVIVGTALYFDGSRRVENGTCGEVVGIAADGGLEVRTDEAEARTVTLRGKQLEAVEPAYAGHVVKAIGTTVKVAMVATGGWTTDKERAYTGLTRATDATHIFVSRDDFEEDVGVALVAELGTRVARSRAKEASIEHEVVAHQAKVERGRTWAAAGRAAIVKRVAAAVRQAARRAKGEGVEVERRGRVRRRAAVRLERQLVPALTAGGAAEIGQRVAQVQQEPVAVKAARAAAATRAVAATRAAARRAALIRSKRTTTTTTTGGPGTDE